MINRPTTIATTRVLLLAPVRELGVQLFTVATELCKYTNIRICLAVGMFLGWFNYKWNTIFNKYFNAAIKTDGLCSYFFCTISEFWQSVNLKGDQILCCFCLFHSGLQSFEKVIYMFFLRRRFSDLQSKCIYYVKNSYNIWSPFELDFWTFLLSKVCYITW